MENNKRQNGITLIALVVTIIVLIILAGVSINLLLGENGIITKTKDAKTEYATSANTEHDQMLNAEKVLDELVGKTTYKSYVVGDVVKLAGEDFYVIEDSNELNASVKLLAKYNVITTEGDTNRYKQDTSANTLAFDDDSNDYATSKIKAHVDAYKIALEGRMGTGKTIQVARLMRVSELNALRGEQPDSTIASTSGCTGTTAFVNATNYWLGSPYEAIPVNVWTVEGSNSFCNNRGYFANSDFGLRPVIVVLKSNI